MTDAPSPPGGGSDPDARARDLVAGTADGADPSADAWLARVCRAVTASLGVQGSVIQVAATGGVSGVAASSDPQSGRFADLAFTTGEGPSVDALALRRPVLVTDLAGAGDRWPGFSQAALAAGLRGVFSLPLQIGGATLGVLDLYATEPRPLSADDLALALSFARLAAHALLGDPLDGVAEDRWEPVLDHRAEVHQAQGMVMVDLGVGLAEALVRMRAYAFSEEIALVDLAHSIISGFVLPAVETDQA